MQTQELLKKSEIISETSETTSETTVSFSKIQADKICAQRLGLLQTIRSAIGLKFYHQISEKLEQEKQLFTSLLNIEDQKQDFLSHYSFVLNPYYFEQQLMN